VALALVAAGSAAAGQDVRADTEAVRIAIFGDSGSGTSDQKAVARQLRRVEEDLRYVFLLGDNVYFTGRAKRFERAFHGPYRRFLERRTDTGERQIAFHAALGNHDGARTCALVPREDGTFPRDRNAYGWREEGCDVEEQLADPAFGYVDQNRYYAVELRGPSGGLLGEVYALDSNTLPSEKHPDRQDTAQLDWLTDTISASRERERRSGVEPWRIITLHHPIRTPSARGYLFGFGGHQEDPSLIRTIESILKREEQEDEPDQVLGGQLQPLLAGGAVDAIFAGHNHFYARLLPGADGIRHFVSGGGGIAVYEPDLESTATAAGGGFHHYVTAVLTRDRFEYCVIDSLGRVRDHGFWLRDAPQDDDRPLEDDRYRTVCRP
jgi:hypothetical protein